MPTLIPMVGIRAFCFFWVIAEYATAQSTTPLATCTNSTYQWTFNSLGQSPCAVTAWLAGVCNGGTYNISPLPASDYRYLGPEPGYANGCECSSVKYSLLSACSLCQSATTYLKWSVYSENCSVVYPGVFPYDIPPSTKVPHWAYLDVVASDGFIPLAAQAALGGAESTKVPSSTSASGPSTSGSISSSSGSPTPSPPAQIGSSSSSSTNAGTIAGAVVGGVVGLALIAALVFCFTYRRRTQRPQSTVDLMPPSMPTSPVSPSVLSYNQTTPLGSKFYDPPDQTMIPSRTTSASNTMQEHHPQLQPNYLIPTQSPQALYPIRNSRFQQYSGAPEP